MVFIGEGVAPLRVAFAFAEHIDVLPRPILAEEGMLRVVFLLLFDHVRVY